MSNTSFQPTQQFKNEAYYTKLLESFRFYFNLRVILLIIISMVIIFFSAEILKIQPFDFEYIVSQNTKQHINHFFFQAETQAKLINGVIHKVVQLQYENMQKHGELYYKQKDELTNVQKMVFEEKYNTTGEYICMNGNCTSLQFYLVNLWSKRNYFCSIQTMYFKYYDPIDNSTNIIYSPIDLNKLESNEIQNLMEDWTESVGLQKIGQNLYFKVRSVFSTSFNVSYEVFSAIELRKSKIMKLLKSDIKLISFYNYKISDTMGWANFQTNQPLPFLSLKIDSTFNQVSYVDPSTNNTLITFYLETPKIRFFHQYIKISVFLPVLILILQLFKQKLIYRQALARFFKSTQRLICLYEYNIEEIFTGKTPKSSTILNNTTTTQFYQELSQIPSSEYVSITHTSKVKIPSKTFLFTEILKDIVQKYNDYAGSVFRQKNKQIISNKFFIHSSVNDISESQSVKIKEALTKAKQLGFVKRFFRFAYSALLFNPKDFDRLIEDDTSPLPEQYIKLMRQINRTVSSTEVRKAFKLSPNIRKETEEELQMRIQINLLQKYLQILKDLDIHNAFAKELGLEDDLENINNYIQNIKHVLNKHNKNIRTLGK